MPPLSPSGTSHARAGAADAEKKANEAINVITAKRMPAIPFARSALACLWASPSKKREGWRVNDRERRRFVALLPYRTRADNGAQRAMLVSGAGGSGRDGHRLVSAPSSDRSGDVPAPYARARRGAGAVERGGLEKLERVYCDATPNTVPLGVLRLSTGPRIGSYYVMFDS